MVEREKLVAMVRALQQGREDAATQIYDTFYNDIYYYILKTVNDPELAADLTQDTFMEILQTIGKLQEPAAFVTWSRQIAYHRCTAHFKKRHDLLLDENEDGVSLFDTLEEDRTEFIPDAALDQAELKQAIHDMIAALPEDQRAAILMRYFEEMSVKEIAQVQGVSEGTVKSRLKYGRDSIEKAVESYEKKNGVKLHCAGAVPLLLWLFAQGEGTATAASVAAGAGATATGAVAATSTAATSATVSTTGAVVAGGLGVKIAAGVAAVAVTLGGIAVGMGLHESPEPKPTTEITQEAATEPEELFWSGYGIDNYPHLTKRFEMRVHEMTQKHIRGYLEVTYLYEPVHITTFEGSGTVAEDGRIHYTITYDTPVTMGMSSHEYWEMVLIYDPETETMTFDNDYYVVMDRVVAEPEEVILSENELWSGLGECDFCWGNEAGHLFELWIYKMTETEIHGYLSVSRNGNMEHQSEFWGQGFAHETGCDYEIMLTSPRTDVIFMGEETIEIFWLYYKQETDSLVTNAMEWYTIHATREKSTKE